MSESSTATPTTEMQRNMEYILSSVEKHELSLRKKHQSTVAKIDKERSTQEKLILRREFYEKLQTNMVAGKEEAKSKLDEAEKAMSIVQQKEKDAENELELSKATLNKVLEQNKRDVLPELDRLEMLLHVSKDEVAISARTYAQDEQRLEGLNAMKKSIVLESNELKESIKDQEKSLSDIQAIPDVHSKELAKVQQDANTIQHDIDVATDTMKQVQSQTVELQKQKVELAEQKVIESKKLHHQQQKLNEKRSCVDGYSRQVADEKIRQHSLATQRVEIELHIKKTQDEIKHNKAFLIAENRQLNVAKNNLVKKQQATIKVKSSTPLMKSKLKELQNTKSMIEAEKHKHEQKLNSMKEKVDDILQNLEDEEYESNDTLEQLDESTKAVAEKECEIEKARIEEKKCMTLLSLTKEKRSFTRRRIENVEQLKSDIDMEIHVSEMQKLDLSKKNRDTDKKTKDFKQLAEMINEERVECTKLIGETKKALDQMKLRHESLQQELVERNGERNEKMKTLHEETNARVGAQQKRATKRSDKSESWSIYQRALEDVERQEAHIDKLKASLSSAKREVERARSQTEQLLAVKDSMSEQLEGKKSSLMEMTECSLTYNATLKRAELDNQQKEEEIHMVELKNKDIQRSIDLLKKDLESPADIEDQIEHTKRSLEKQILETQRLCNELESPNHSRIRHYSGEDPSEEELVAKLSTLERLVHNKKEVLLTKSIQMQELSLHIQQTQQSRKDWLSSTQTILNDINEYKSRLQEKERFYTAQQSELQMYNEIIESSKTRIAELEHDLSLRNELAVTTNQAKNSTTNKNEKRDALEAVQDDSAAPSSTMLRPTAYLPLDENENTLNIPRPYGARAPFKPSKSVTSIGSAELYRLKEKVNTRLI